MKKGTILRNECVSNTHPFRYSVYIGTSGQYINTIYVYEGAIKKCQYYKRDIGKSIIPIRETDALKRMTEVLAEELEKEVAEGSDDLSIQ